MDHGIYVLLFAVGLFLGMLVLLEVVDAFDQALVELRESMK